MGRPPKMAATMAAVLVLSGALAACSSTESDPETEPPITVEETADPELSVLTLSASAADRLDIQTATVEPAESGLVVPSAAVIIDPEGVYWVYTNPEPLVYLRHEIRPVHEEGLQAFFEEGPAAGTAVVITGVPELYGAEFGIGK